jgi:hypothetical protein
MLGLGLDFLARREQRRLDELDRLRALQLLQSRDVRLCAGHAHQVETPGKNLPRHS